jgi:DNA repair photolyase
MDHDFEDIEVKTDALQILEEQLRRKRKPCMISTGSMCDPYIHLEKELEITRKSLELIERYGFGVAIQTKSALILRDLDLLKRINAQTKAVVQMTLTTYDEDLCRIVEPHVSTTSERFHVLEVMRDEGIPTVVWLSPILPFINDTEENLRGILDYCIRARVHAIISFGIGLTLREGDREYYYQKLDQHFPGIKREYISRYGNAYECRSPENNQLMSILRFECQKQGILLGSDEVFRYMHAFEQKDRQLSFLDL